METCWFLWKDTVMFDMPDINRLGDFTNEALIAMRAEADTEFRTTFATASRDNGLHATEEDVNRLEALRTFTAGVDGILEARTVNTKNIDCDPRGASERLASLAASSGGDDDKDLEPIPGIADITTGDQDLPDTGQSSRLGYMVASAGHDQIAAGQRIDLTTAAELVNRRLRGLDAGMGSTILPVFSAHRPSASSDLVLHGDRRDTEVLDAACDETRLPHGSLIAEFAAQESLTAGSGWCAVSDTNYDVPTTFAAEGMLDVSRIPAPRGGVNLYPELLATTAYGGFTGTNYFSLTEAQVQAETPKNMVEVGCPDPHEYRLAVRGLGVVTNLLALKALPEYTSKFINGATTLFSYFENTQHIAAIQAGSVAVNLAADPLWASDGSVFSQVMAAAEMAAVDIRASKLLPLNATIDTVWPVWILAQIRADLMRRAGLAPSESMIADRMIINEFAARGIRAQFVRNYQDAWSGAGGVGLGQAVRLTQLPTALEFLAYPAGTWVLAELPVITVNIVYDAVRLAVNQRLELFTESGWAMIPRLTGSYRYQLLICPNGATGAPHTIACDEQTPPLQ
jgi:hypothetical protein